MNKGDGNEHFDDDILKSKADVLRARDIMPPYKKQPPEERKTQNDTESAEKEAALFEDASKVPAEGSGAAQKQSEIPRFDLAERIMAEQRRITAVRREAPGKHIEPKTKGPADKPAGHSVGEPRSAEPYEEKVIADIVARDIERLLRGEATDV